LAKRWFFFAHQLGHHFHFSTFLNIKYIKLKP
jgi:hypothetical protein